MQDSLNPPGDPVSEPHPPTDAAATGSEAHPHQADSVADGIDHRLDPRYVVLQRLTGWLRVAIQSLLWGAATFTILALLDLPSPSIRIPIIIWALATVALALLSQRWPGVAYRHASYRVDERGLEIRRGVLWRRVITVPRSRVQHTDVSQGPIERRFGLGVLAVHTAGTEHAMVRLPGLEHGRALRIREHLLPRREHDVV
jgi:membrane protein YdbS with pleckstrin-like domain